MTYLKYAVLALLILILLSAIGTAAGIITLPYHKLTAQIQTNHDIVDKTYNAENALYNYHWFQERMGEIKATETKIQTSEETTMNFEKSAGERTKWGAEDKTEYYRLVSVTSGLKNYYQDIVNEYNARAQEADRNIFKDDLPLFFALKPF